MAISFGNDDLMESFDETAVSTDMIQDDVVDLELLGDQLEQIKKADSKIANEDVMVLIGATGAGKVRFW